MALLQTAQQEADQVAGATFLTMLVTVKNMHFRRTIPHTHIFVHTPTSPGNGIRSFVASRVIILLFSHWLLLETPGFGVFLIPFLLFSLLLFLVILPLYFLI